MQVVLCLIVKNNCFGGGGRKKNVCSSCVSRAVSHTFVSCFLIESMGQSWRAAGTVQSTSWVQAEISQRSFCTDAVDSPANR